MRNAVPSALQINPPNAGAPKGVRSTSPSRRSTGGRAVRGEDAALLDHRSEPRHRLGHLGPDGNAVITDPGTNAGPDTVVAFVDFNNDGTRQAAEPQASALATFVDSVPPTCTVKVSGDRPGGSGGAGKPLIISVNCNEASTVTVQTSLSRAAAARARPRSTRRSPRRRR